MLVGLKAKKGIAMLVRVIEPDYYGGLRLLLGSSY